MLFMYNGPLPLSHRLHQDLGQWSYAEGYSSHISPWEVSMESRLYTEKCLHSASSNNHACYHLYLILMLPIEMVCERLGPRKSSFSFLNEAINQHNTIEGTRWSGRAPNPQRRASLEEMSSIAIEMESRAKLTLLTNAITLLLDE